MAWRDGRRQMDHCGTALRALKRRFERATHAGEPDRAGLRDDEQGARRRPECPVPDAPVKAAEG